MSADVHTLKTTDTLEGVRSWMETDAPHTSHQGFPVLDEAGVLIGVLTRRNLLDPKKAESTTLRELIGRRPSFVYEDLTLRDAADHMVRHDVGRLPVVSRETRRVIGIVTRSDLLRAHRRRLVEHEGEAAWAGGNGRAAAKVANVVESAR